MIKRIKKIMQVGIFRDLNSSGSVPIGDKKIAVIFGLNTKGKSTLASILQSIGDDEPQHVINRLSIPHQIGVNQQIELTYQTANDATEKNLNFTNGKWQNNKLKDHILVFDQNFVHINVISGDSITRDNRAHFTDFILGSEGVKLSNEIETKNKQLRMLKTELKNLRPKYVRTEPDEKVAENFIRLDIEDAREDIVNEKESHKKRLTRLENIEKFKALKQPDLVIDNIKKATESLKNEIESILNESYLDVSDAAWSKLKVHIANNCSGEHAVSWLKDGLKINKSSSCPYCGQNLSDAKDLISAYQSIFNAKLEQYETALSNKIQQFKLDLRSLLVKSVNGQITNFIKDTEAFNPYIPELEEQIGKARNDVQDLISVEEVYKNAIAVWDGEVQKLIKAKELSFYKKVVNTSDSEILQDSLNRLMQGVSKANVILIDIESHIKNAQNKMSKLNTQQVLQEAQEHKNVIIDLDKKLARIDENEECELYIEKLKQINSLKKEIVDLINKLEMEQSEYLEKYFECVNYWFEQLGSRGFKIEKTSTNKGDKKVYALRLEFNDQKIQLERISEVFSESDRRNLAFSVFMARAEQLKNKRDIVLVLDDPVVSFDDNRISKTCREIELVANNYAQIIILTHYKSLVTELATSKIDANYVEICPSVNNTLTLAVMDSTRFVVSDHEKNCDIICSFVDGSSNQETLRLLRPFMEAHLRLVFQKQILTNSLYSLNLGKLIDKLFELKLITDDSKKKLHIFRKGFNFDLHTIAGNENVENIRLDARDMMDLLFDELTQREVVAV